ncbi:S4 domain-containing protein YaaA [Loigolactobacillus zhaoyuanensis]|uniref:S4 domain-containing protein YaaA n=1 Tax=Loigolactobacillus zhaoyuanensis TaxID=2486017 RepID=A0ABW8UF20_9LACO|nr:S4 domain-containing protein YaaA [Loigolactobacillus zhaoyuanensis]
MKKIVYLETAYLTLGQLLKDQALIDSGGQAKWFLREQTVFVNGIPEDRRGRKLVAGDAVEIPDTGSFFLRTATDDQDVD